MILKIDTTITNTIKITLLQGEKIFLTKEIFAPRSQSENLLPTVINALAEAKITWSGLSCIAVVVDGGSFTSLRIGVLTANALAYATNLPLQAISANGEDVSKDNLKKFLDYKIAVPEYNTEPNIGKSKKASKQIPN